MERKPGWHQGRVVAACWLRCSDKDRSLRRRNQRTYPFVAEPAEVREVCPLRVATGERPVGVVAGQLSGSVAVELCRQGMSLACRLL